MHAPRLRSESKQHPGFIAAWDTISFWIGSETVGFEYDLNGNFSLLGSDGVSGLQSQLSLQSQPVSAQAAPASGLTVPADAAQLPGGGATRLGV